jgi:hypothetical protein
MSAPAIPSPSKEVHIRPPGWLSSWLSLRRSRQHSLEGQDPPYLTPHGPEPAQGRVLSRPVVSARFLLYSNWIFFVSFCDLVYPPGSVNA